MTRLAALQACATPDAVSALLRKHGIVKAADPLARLLAQDVGVREVRVGGGGTASVWTTSGVWRRVPIGEAAEAWLREWDDKLEGTVRR